MIDLENRILFIHIPKCAGTFIEKNVTPEIDWHKKGEKHFSMQRCLEVYGEEKVRSCFRFAVVRNPFFRLVSFYLYHRRLGTELFCITVFEKYTRAFRTDYHQSFSGFVFNLKHYFHKLEAWARHDISPCHFFLISHQGIGVDMILKQENLSEDLAKLMETTGVQFRDERINASPDCYDLSGYYRQQEIDFVLDFYRADFFHYYQGSQLGESLLSSNNNADPG